MANDKYVKPFRLADELYYIGSDKGPSYLLDTSDGIVLIDTGYPVNLEMLLDNIRALGYDPKNIKHIVHSHGHIDHIGCTAELVKMTGARAYVGEGDASSARGLDPFNYAGELKIKYSPFEPDVIIKDGEIIAFGDTEIRFISTPGHTFGTLSMFFSVHFGGKTYLAGMFGGAGLNTLSNEYLDKYAISHSMRERYIESIDKIINEPVQLHVGNHIGDNDGRNKMLEPYGEKNPFLENNTYVSFLSQRKRMVMELIEESK